MGKLGEQAPQPTYTVQLPKIKDRTTELWVGDIGKEYSNKAMQSDGVRAVQLHECSYLTFYHAIGHRIHRG